jgi:hypothetical protein
MANWVLSNLSITWTNGGASREYEWMSLVVCFSVDTYRAAKNVYAGYGRHR